MLSSVIKPWRLDIKIKLNKEEEMDRFEKLLNRIILILVMLFCFGEFMYSFFDRNILGMILWGSVSIIAAVAEIIICSR